jgi:hypothetical protein
MANRLCGLTYPQDRACEILTFHISNLLRKVPKRTNYSCSNSTENFTLKYHLWNMITTIHLNFFRNNFNSSSPKYRVHWLYKDKDVMKIKQRIVKSVHSHNIYRTHLWKSIFNSQDRLRSTPRSSGGVWNYLAPHSLQEYVHWWQRGTS